MRKTHLTALLIVLATGVWLASGYLGGVDAVADHPSISEQNAHNAANGDDREPTVVRARTLTASAYSDESRTCGRLGPAYGGVGHVSVPARRWRRPPKQGFPEKESPGDNEGMWGGRGMLSPGRSNQMGFSPSIFKSPRWANRLLRDAVS